jgi:hypothetical protein
LLDGDPPGFWPLNAYVRAACEYCKPLVWGANLRRCPHFEADDDPESAQGTPLPGIYAFEEGRLAELFEWAAGRPGLVLWWESRKTTGRQAGLVFGRVALAGRIHRHERGFRAEKARVLDLAGPRPGFIYIITPEARLEEMECPFPELPIWVIPEVEIRPKMLKTRLSREGRGC